MASSLPPEDVLPIIVADLADDESRDVLEAAAFTGGRVCVPLESAPVSASQHVLEVYVPSSKEPLLFLAIPVGPPTEDGFPLRIHPMPNAKPSMFPPSASGGVVRARRQTHAAIGMSASHTKDLSFMGPLPTEPDDHLVGRALAGGKLKIESLIGRGGVGAVYQARHRELKMPVAVKVLHESFQHDLDFCRRFYAEALAASRLDHANITRVIDFGQEPDGLLYLAMEFLDGVELRSVLDKERVLDARRIVEVMMQVCAGLSHAHARGIVHRDIKPENLVLVPAVDDDGRSIEVVKVCDFGIAQHRAVAPDAEGSLSGTPEYMSPEQARGDELDARSDIYACGIVLYEAATGELPFSGDRTQTILDKQRSAAPLPPSKIRPGVDPLLERIILKALAKDPAHRQQSMRELRQELRELLRPIVVGAASPPPPLAADTAAVEAAPPSRHDGAPDWLERGHFVPAQPTGATASGVAIHDELADALATDAAGWMQRFAKAAPNNLPQLGARLETAMRAVAARGEAKTLWVVSSGLHNIAMNGGTQGHAEIAARLLQFFADPSILGVVAEQLLAGREDGREFARRLLVNAGVAGAYGLYAARVKLAADPAIRSPFIATLKDFGPKAWPVVRAALEKIFAMPEGNRGALDLAEDLLLCVPVVGDESAGHLVVKYLRVNSSGVCRSATAAIVKMWGERAKPLLVGMLQSKDDVVRIAGIAGLRQLSGIDEHVVPRLHAILTRRIAAGDDLRAAAAVALAHATPGARQPAMSLLAQLLAPAREPPRDPRATQSDVLSREDAVVVAVARSLLHLGGPGQRALVGERAERGPEPLRRELRKLLG